MAITIVPKPEDESYLLLQTGDVLLLQTGDSIVLTTGIGTGWSIVAKPAE